MFFDVLRDICHDFFAFRGYTGWFFSLVPPRKVLSMELVPPNREKWLSLQRWQKTLLKKWKSKSEFVKPSLFTVTWQEFFYVWQAVTWTFTFLVGILLSLVNLVIFSLLGGTSSILRTFLGGTSQNKHPVAPPASTHLQHFETKLTFYIWSILSAFSSTSSPSSSSSW